MRSRVIAIAIKETRQLVRDPITIVLAFVIPLLMLQLFGYGLSLDVKHIPIVFIDYDRSDLSRDYIDQFITSEYFELISIEIQQKQADKLIQSGKARVIVDIPPDFSRKLRRREHIAVGVTVDGSLPSHAEVITTYLTSLHAQFNAELMQQTLNSMGTDIDSLIPVQMSYTVWFNPSLESINMIVPGMLVLILMLFPALQGALLIAGEKESGSIFNLYCSPVKRWEVLIGKALPYVVVAFINYLIIFAASIIQFDVRFIGSFWLLALAALLYTFCTVGMGLFFSVITRTQLAAMLLTLLLTITSAFNYSGFLTPVASMDTTGQIIAHLLPATYFMDVVRGSYLKGLDFHHQIGDLSGLVIYTVVIYSLAWSRFKKRIG